MIVINKLSVRERVFLPFPSLSFSFVTLRQVYFPSVTVCNINQVRESFLLDMNLTRSDPEGQVCTQS